MNSLNDDNRYHTTNPLVTNEDIIDHYGVGAIIHNRTNQNQILIFYHAKYQFYTVPIGKVSLFNDPILGMIKEMKEELGITINTFTLMGTFQKTYHRGSGVYTRINSHLYDVVSYNSEPTNMEPEKHPIMAWMTIEDISKISQEKISDAVRFYLALKEILGCECKQLVR